MSKQQLAAILEMSAPNPIPANATPAAMRAWVEAMFRIRRHSRTARSEAGEL